MFAARPDFSFEARFVARDSLVWDGQEIAVGAAFSWRDLGVSEQQLWDLWAAFKIDAVPSNTDVAVPLPPASSPASVAADSVAAVPVESIVTPEPVVNVSAPKQTRRSRG